MNSPVGLIASSLSGNSAPDTGGVYVVGGSASALINDILWGDTGGEAKADQSSGATVLNISYSLVSGCNPGSQWVAACGTNTGSNLADIDPKYVDPANGNLRLQKTSPAIDKGNNHVVSGQPTDRAGSVRIFGSTVDLGAYEFTIYPGFLPIIKK